MCQILSLDKEMILQRIGYQEFGQQMIHELDPECQAVAFKALARLALDSSITTGNIIAFKIIKNKYASI